MSNVIPPTAGVSRNAQCPCGSGRRYKDCHGKLAAQDPRLRIPDESTQRQLDAALAAQLAGRFAEAVARYQAVVADQPDLFDALHMLGVTYYQRGEFERAQEFVASALRLSPSDAPARQNLKLIESVLERRSVEREICRQTLWRLGPRCIAPISISDEAVDANMAFDFVVSRPDAFDRQGIVERLAGWFRPASLTVWLYPGMRSPTSAAWPVRVIGPESTAIPDRRHVVFVGADRSPADWFERSAATEVALFCADESPCTLLDRILELAREGATPLRLVYAEVATANRIGLPGVVLAAAAQRN